MNFVKVHRGNIYFVVGIYLIINIIQVTYFLCTRSLDCVLVAWSLPTGAALGFSVFCFEKISSSLQFYLLSKMRKLHAGFLLFFFYLIGYVVIFSAVSSFPFGKILFEKTAVSDIANEYGLYSVNLIIILSILSWLNWFRIAVLSRGDSAASFLAKTRNRPQEIT